MRFPEIALHLTLNALDKGAIHFDDAVGNANNAKVKEYAEKVSELYNGIYNSIQANYESLDED